VGQVPRAQREDLVLLVGKVLVERHRHLLEDVRQLVVGGPVGVRPPRREQLARPVHERGDRLVLGLHPAYQVGVELAHSLEQRRPQQLVLGAVMVVQPLSPTSRHTSGLAGQDLGVMPADDVSRGVRGTRSNRTVR
jgi:hypothetical protein